MSVQIEYDDSCAPWLEAALKNFPQYDRRAMKSVGWMLSKKMKEGIRSGAPGGHAYAALSGLRKVKSYEDRVLRRRKSGAFLGKMARAIGYEWREEDGSLHVGWLSRSAARFGTILQGGQKQTVTPKMRAFYAASGFVLKKSTSEIELPARPTIEPLRVQLAPQIGPYYVDKVSSYLDKELAPSVKPRRRYRVWGD